MKKFWLLFGLLIGPLIFYLLLLTGEKNFRTLPVLQENIIDISSLEPDQEVAFKDHINILCFFGNDLLNHKTNALNLNEKIYKHFYKFKTFQFVVILPLGTEAKANQLKKELDFTTDVSKWKFLFTTKENIKTIFDSLHTNLTIDQKSYCSSAFIIDKDVSLRGRNDDEDIANGKLFGYNAEHVSMIHQKMIDDVKIVLAEYRLALKKNKKKKVFKNPYQEKK